MSKPHYFELVMNSYSDGELNQEIVIIREYASTPGELVAKQMQFSESASVPIVQAVLAATGEMSAPIREMGQQELMAAFADWAGKGKAPPGKSK